MSKQTKFLLVGAALCAVILFSFMAGRYSADRYEFKAVDSRLYRCDRSTGDAERVFPY